MNFNNDNISNSWWNISLLTKVVDKKTDTANQKAMLLLWRKKQVNVLLTDKSIESISVECFLMGQKRRSKLQRQSTTARKLMAVELLDALQLKHECALQACYN